MNCVQEKEALLAKSRGQQLHADGGPAGSPPGPNNAGGGGPHHHHHHHQSRGAASPPSPSKRDGKKCESPMKHELGGMVGMYPPTSKMKIEPGDSPGGLDCGGLQDGRLMDQAINSPGKDDGVGGGGGGLLPAGHAYLGKEEVPPHLLGHLHHMSGMSLDPSIQQMSEAGGGGGGGGGSTAICNNFSVDSLMTTVGREGGGSPVDNRLAALQDMSGYSSSHYPPSCLYPANSSLEELSNMTAAAACLPQTLMSPPYSRPNWYSMPGGHSPTAAGGGGQDQVYPPPHQSREYFEPLGKPPSPSSCSVAPPYRTPPYRTYYPQECEKY